MFRTVFVATAIALCLTEGLDATSPPKFAVVSIRRQAPDDNSFFLRPPANGRFSATGSVTRLSVMLAYDVQESQIVGGPAWFGTDRFVIEARSDDNQPHSVTETREMLQNMLTERFSLRVHRETLEGSVYVLTVAKKLGQSEHEGNPNVRVSGDSIQIDGAELSRMTQLLSDILGRPVIDQTGLHGIYDASLVWGDAPVIDGGILGTAAAAGSETDHESIFSAIQDQLGLNVVSRRVPIDVLVIDGIDMPSENQRPSRQAPPKRILRRMVCHERRALLLTITVRGLKRLASNPVLVHRLVRLRHASSDAASRRRPLSYRTCSAQKNGGGNMKLPPPRPKGLRAQPVKV
jgi:uncharacterized protein (TIGR03435 family)